jgi:sRNA-binding carbon storage regulator CsrA
MLNVIINNGGLVHIGEAKVHCEIVRGKIRLAIDAPRSVNIVRDEVLEKHRQMKLDAEQNTSSSG